MALRKTEDSPRYPGQLSLPGSQQVTDVGARGPGWTNSF